MLFTCSACHYTLCAEKEQSSCPDCGEIAVHKASPDEVERYGETQSELKMDNWLAKSLEWKAQQEQKLKEVAPIVEAVGMTTEAYLQQRVQDVANIAFLASKGFTSTKEGLIRAKVWLEIADPDDMMYGERAGDPFDIAMGNLRRSMLLNTVDRLLSQSPKS